MNEKIISIRLSECEDKKINDIVDKYKNKGLNISKSEVIRMIIKKYEE